ncbi:RNA-binding cell elongation regulator Jag/EloR [Ammoniphilus sp. CFH 90114]|uniref:RNA-binding cell elongation regulator Jag/EloR n=1 Tax=Ammoniphilus sp. CFH 90114 TaxID=2493665 RepID=UPI00100DDA36|nr:RNA-binding cell elongation regulator Jag/EloR [Ammoniphilus sp. CFH 90114]RXT08895.1 protein jag [Ammoniphilus sp. CFH 90114]
MKKVTVTAKTVDEAIALALKQLNAEKNQVTVTILEEPTKGFFGFIGARPAKLEVELKIDPIQEAKTFLQDILATMSVTATIEVKNEKDATLLDIIGEDLGIIIGRRGQTLDSLQFLVNTVANKHSDSYLRIVLDAENYRLKRRQTLEQLADRLAHKAIKTGQVIKLEPMPSHERKVIHTFLQERKNINTYSEGQDPNRYIVIQAKK